jgi:hypothetical protein
MKMLGLGSKNKNRGSERRNRRWREVTGTVRNSGPL